MMHDNFMCALDFTSPNRKYNEATNQVINGVTVTGVIDMSKLSTPERTNLPINEGRRGRPSSDSVPSLIEYGQLSPSTIRCPVCDRVFPREKSLQAHLRTHTGERPFLCDYPGCGKAFAQSGQLNTHSRLHTGEKPFQCSAEGCTARFTHANRHCNDHPHASIRRSPDENIIPPNAVELSEDARRWFQNYQKSKDDRTPKGYRNKRCTKGTPNTPISPYMNKDSNTSAIRVTKSKRVLEPLLDQERLNKDLPPANSNYARQRDLHSEGFSHIRYTPSRPVPVNFSSLRQSVQDRHNTTEGECLRLQTSKIESSESRFSQYCFSPAKSIEYKFEIEGIKPLDTEEYCAYNPTSTNSVYSQAQDRRLNLSDSYFPDQLCVGDRTPMKSTPLRPDGGSTIKKAKFEPLDSPSDNLSAEVLAVPRTYFYSNPDAMEKRQMDQHQPHSPATSMFPMGFSPKYNPKKRWLYATLKNTAEETQQPAVSESTDSTSDTNDNKDTILGAMALVQLAKFNDDSMQPLNLSTK